MPEPYQALISSNKEKEAPDFKFDDESTPFSAEGKEIAQLIRRKAPDDEFVPVLEAIEKAAATSGLPNPQLSSTDVLVTSICWIGSKSISHLLSCIDRCRERLVSISSSPEMKQQIITSILDYWNDHPGTGVNIVGKLLNYQILTPTNVLDWVLLDHVARGTILSKAWAYELVLNTLNKVTGRVRQIVSRARTPGTDEGQSAMLKELLGKETKEMRQLFERAEDSLSGIQKGYQDEMMEASDQLREEEEPFLKAWGTKWARVMQRRLAVEENWIKEELAKPLPPAPTPAVALGQPKEPKEEQMGEGVRGGASAANGQNGVGVEAKSLTNGDDGAHGFQQQVETEAK